MALFAWLKCLCGTFQTSQTIKLLSVNFLVSSNFDQCKATASNIETTVEPVYLDPGKCRHLCKADTKPWS